MNRLLLIGAIGLAVLLVLVKPWDSGGERRTHKDIMISAYDEAMTQWGAPESARKCVTDGIEQTFSDSNVEHAKVFMEDAAEVGPGQLWFDDPENYMLHTKLDHLIASCPGSMGPVESPPTFTSP